MNEVRKPELAEAKPDLGASFAQVSSDATRRLCEHGQSVAKTISEWNTEVGHFLSHRAARNSETMGRMTKCRSVPEVLAIQAQWVQDTADDYLKEMSKLMEVNSRMMGGLFGSFGQTGAQSAEQPRSLTAKVPMRAAN
jgi:Phasin protein